MNKLHAENQVLILKTVDKNMQGSRKFQYPEAGLVECDNWTGRPGGNTGGLFGQLWGGGKYCLLSFEASARWLVIAVNPADVVEFDNKCKFHKGTVLNLPKDRETATAYMYKYGDKNVPVHGLILSAGDNKNIIAGDRAKISSGNGATVTAGGGSTITGGDGSKIIAGDGSKIIAGKESTIFTGDESEITAGDKSEITAGDWAKITTGERSKISAGIHSRIAKTM